MNHIEQAKYLKRKIDSARQDLRQDRYEIFQDELVYRLGTLDAALAVFSQETAALIANWEQEAREAGELDKEQLNE